MQYQNIASHSEAKVIYTRHCNSQYRLQLPGGSIMQLTIQIVKSGGSQMSFNIASRNSYAHTIAVLQNLPCGCSLSFVMLQNRPCSCTLSFVMLQNHPCSCTLSFVILQNRPCSCSLSFVILQNRPCGCTLGFVILQNRPCSCTLGFVRQDLYQRVVDAMNCKLQWDARRVSNKACGLQCGV